MMLEPKMSRFKAVLFSAVILFATAIVAHAGEYQVSRVIDGDTIEVKKGAIKLTIRLVGIDAPEESHKKYEPGQPFSQKSSQYLAKIAMNHSADVNHMVLTVMVVFWERCSWTAIA